MLLAVALAGLLSTAPAGMRAARTGLPVQLSDEAFWRIIETFSEPSGYFNSENLVSNEDTFQSVIPALVETVGPGDVYIGVGPDQNFTYIAAIDPGMSFIPDLRRGNLHVHLMYKALFELSADRAEFVARLFSRPRPADLGQASTARDLFLAYQKVAPDSRFHDANRRAILEQLTVRRKFRLQGGDEAGIAYAYSQFFAGGPAMTFVSSAGGRNRSYPTFETLQLAADAAGVTHGYLASEAAFQRVKSQQERNLVIPVVGNFAGAKALPAIAAYVREHDAKVTAFYTSNVELYLFQDKLWDQFRANVARLPIDATSTFIRSCFNTCSSPGGSRSVTLLDSISGLLADAASGRIRSYWDVLTHSRELAAR
jgi:hypothetical protein